MNKNIKKTISLALAASAISILEPTGYLNLITTKAYASSDIYLSSISVIDGDSITLSKSKKKYTINVPNSTKETTIRVTANDKDDKVTIDGQTPEQKSSKKYTLKVDLEKGNDNEFEIVVENGDDERTYTLTINRGGKEDDDPESVFLDTINLDYGDIDFSREKTEYDVEVDEDVSELRVQAKPEDTSDEVFIDGNKVNDDDKYRRSIKLTKGANTIYINIEDDEDDDNEKTYTLNVYRGKNPNSTSSADTSKFDEKQDEIYLDNIKINDGDTKLNPNFNKKITSYAVDVNEDVEDIVIKGETENDANIVKINGTKADSNNRKRVSLTKGKNVVEIQVNIDCDTDDKDYLKRVYTLTVYRGTSEGTASSNSTDSTTAKKEDVQSPEKNDSQASNINQVSNTNNIKYNQWVNNNGKWQFNDISGNALKNTWYYDNSTGHSYYLQADGTMATGWIMYNGSWYYLDESGAKQIGWKQLGSNWYHLDAEGKMNTGWFLDSDGKYYYFYESGVMAANATINGYKLNGSGVWIH